MTNIEFHFNLVNKILLKLLIFQGVFGKMNNKYYHVKTNTDVIYKNTEAYSHANKIHFRVHRLTENGCGCFLDNPKQLIIFRELIRFMFNIPGKLFN